MTVYHQDDEVTVHHGDCMDVMRELPDNSVDAVVTDPPYDLTAGKRGGSGVASVNLDTPYGRSRIGTGNGGGGFMGQAWDATGIAFNPEVWELCLRVLKPGGYLVSFGGTRTWHRMACAIEDAGFEIRENLAWLTGQGFPKNLDVAKAIDKAAGAEREVIDTIAARMPQAQATGWGNPGVDTFRDKHKGTVEMAVTVPATDAAKQWQGYGTSLKPAFEPIVLARKPLQGTVAANVQAWGTGALNIDACRVATTDSLGGGANKAETNETRHAGYNRPWRDDPEAQAAKAERSRENTARAEALGRWPPNVLLDEYAAQELDAQTGTLTSGKAAPGGHVRGEPRGEGIYGGGKGLWSEAGSAGVLYGDSGGASRFFPVFKYTAKAPGDERPVVDGVAHPTVKPVELLSWLVKLITPPHGVVLDPFAGTGTTGEACILEHMRAILIEREAGYLPLIKARLNKPIQVGFDFGE